MPLSTINPSWSNLGTNPGLRGEICILSEVCIQVKMELLLAKTEFVQFLVNKCKLIVLKHVITRLHMPSFMEIRCVNLWEIKYLHGRTWLLSNEFNYEFGAKNARSPSRVSFVVWPIAVRHAWDDCGRSVWIPLRFFNSDIGTTLNRKWKSKNTLQNTVFVVMGVPINQLWIF